MLDLVGHALVLELHKPNFLEEGFGFEFLILVRVSTLNGIEAACVLGVAVAREEFRAAGDEYLWEARNSGEVGVGVTVLLLV